MEHATATILKKTSLHGRHRASGARLVAYAGWEMPLEYSGIVSEHLAVRTKAGLFDVSHMGEIEVAGKDALAALQQIVCSDVASVSIGHAQYSGILTHQGTFLDDLLVYRLGREHFLLVVNAGRTTADYGWIVEHLKDAGDVVAVDASSRYAMLALQGPAAVDTLQPLTGVALSELRRYAFAHGEVANVRATIARTGYTGEDGFELLVPPQSADRVWQAILASGESAGVVPAGLGARDTLRLEAGMRLYGNDIDETTTPLEAGLERMIGWNKGDFNGVSVLRAQRQGVNRMLVGFELLEDGIARAGHTVSISGAAVGRVTSGTRTPFLQKSIGMAYVSSEYASIGTEVEVDIRGRNTRGVVVRLPFYRRSGAS